MGENKDNILKDKKIMKKLKISCENIKKTLSTHERTTLNINKFYNNKDMLETISRESFENICQDLFDRLMIPLEKALTDAHLAKENISKIVLVGGSTRIPRIKKDLENYFGKKCYDSINADETVAYGATLMAAKILIKNDKRLKGFNLMDIAPYSLGIAVKNNSTLPQILKEGESMSVIIKRTSKIACSNESLYETSSDNQTEAKIKIYEGEKKYVKYNHILGELLLIGLPPKPKGEVKIKVKLNLDVNGILTVYASELSKDKKEIKQIKTEINYQSFSKDKKKFEELKNRIRKINNNDDIEVKTNYNSDIKESLEEYKDSLISNKNSNNKIYAKILKNYIQTYEEFIDSFDKDFDNETMLEKYFIFMKELFASYVEIIKIEDITIDKIKEKIKNYLKIFTKKSSGYLTDLFEILKDLPEEIFYEIITYTMQEINIIAKKCMEEKKEFCRYNTLIYFEKAYSLFNKYINDFSKLGVCSKGIIENCKIQVKISLVYINEIKSGAILLLEDSLKEGKLISSNKTGFTFGIKNLIFSPKDTQEEFEIVLQNYENMLREFPQCNNSNLKGKKKAKNALESKPSLKEAICIANIIKINVRFLGNNNYSRINELCKRCEFIASKLKITEEQDWYKEFKEIYKEIKENQEIMRLNWKEIKDKIRNDNIDEITILENKFFTKKNNMEYINFILENYPYEDYKKEEQKSIDFTKESQELLDFLRGKYHIDNYSYEDSDPKSQLKFYIMEIIHTNLNNMFNEN